MFQNTKDLSSLGFAGCCAWSGAYSLVRCLNMLCDVDFVLLRMIFFVLTCEAGRCRTWVFGQYLPFVFAFFVHAVVASMC